MSDEEIECLFRYVGERKADGSGKEFRGDYVAVEICIPDHKICTFRKPTYHAELDAFYKLVSGSDDVVGVCRIGFACIVLFRSEPRAFDEKTVIQEAPFCSSLVRFILFRRCRFRSPNRRSS